MDAGTLEQDVLNGFRAEEMEMSSNQKSEERIRRAIARHRIDPNSFEQLAHVVHRWDKFVQRLFSISLEQQITQDLLERYALEETQRYLDVKIQMTNCLGQVRDQELEKQFESLCSKIKKSSYHFLSIELPNIGDNQRSLRELDRIDRQPKANDSYARLDWIPGAELGASPEYKDCLIQEGKQLQSNAIRLRARVVSNLATLKKMITENLGPFLADR